MSDAADTFVDRGAHRSAPKAADALEGGERERAASVVSERDARKGASAAAAADILEEGCTRERAAVAAVALVDGGTREHVSATADALVDGGARKRAPALLLWAERAKTRPLLLAISLTTVSVSARLLLLL